jgi:CheY-like chemotaxis protein
LPNTGFFARCGEKLPIIEGVVKRYIAILEDDERRVHEMRRCLESTAVALRFFANAPEMLAWLRDHLKGVALISLDHDLPVQRCDTRVNDCGTGRDVVDYLTSQEPVCPVLVHSSNASAASGMLYALKGAGWTTKQVYPHDDLCWIADDWTTEISAWLEL